LTVVASRAGATAVHVVIALQSTLVASLEPKRKIVAVVPRPNPVPVTVTLVPPAAGPLLGLTLVIVGGPNLK
jgi:hypothetical protein